MMAACSSVELTQPSVKLLDWEEMSLQDTQSLHLATLSTTGGSLEPVLMWALGSHQELTGQLCSLLEGDGLMSVCVCVCARIRAVMTCISGSVIFLPNSNFTET